MYSGVVLSGALTDSMHQVPWIMQRFPVWQKLERQGEGKDFKSATFYFYVLKAEICVNVLLVYK